MRSFRRLPPLLRALWLLGLLALLAAVSVFTWTVLATRENVQPAANWARTRGYAMSVSFVWLGLACNLMPAAYTNSRERPGRSAPWPEAWQTHLKVTVAFAALPLCSLVFALLVPPSSALFQLGFPLALLCGLVLVGGIFWTSRYYR